MSNNESVILFENFAALQRPFLPGRRRCSRENGSSKYTEIAVPMGNGCGLSAMKLALRDKQNGFQLMRVWVFRLRNPSIIRVWAITI